MFNRTSGPPVSIGDEEEEEGEVGEMVKKSKVKAATAKKQTKEPVEETTAAAAAVEVQKEKPIAASNKRKASAVSKVPSTVDGSTEDVQVKEEKKLKGRVTESNQALVSLEDATKEAAAAVDQEDSSLPASATVLPAKRIRTSRKLR